MDSTWANIAEYSSTISIAVIIGCFLSMAVFILRLNLTGKVDMNPADVIPGRMMRGVHNPYNLVLATDKSANLKDGVWLEMRCQASCIIQALWGVSIAELYPGIFLQWEEYHQQVLNDSWLEEHVSYRSLPQRYEACDNVRLKLEVPEGVDLQMGAVPRSKYPLVVVLLSDDINQDQQGDLCVTSLVAIFHLQDEECTGKSHIICQYIRTPTSSPCQLQQLYVASTDEGESTPDSGNQTTEASNSGGPTSESITGGNPSSGECIVCQTESINRALLPCRHACVCDGCFLRLDKCPMCRCLIESYFQLTPTEGGPWLDDENEPPKPWWEDWNDRLNAYLGFR